MDIASSLNVSPRVSSVALLRHESALYLQVLFYTHFFRFPQTHSQVRSKELLSNGFSFGCSFNRGSTVDISRLERLSNF